MALKFHIKTKKSTIISRRGLKRWIEVLPFIITGLILLSVFVVYPLLRNIYMSFTEYNILLSKTEKIVYFDNYIRAFKDPKVHVAFVNTILYGLITVPFQMIFGLIIAAVINSKIKGKLFFRVLYYIPVISSWVVVSLIFRYLFESGKGGFINYFLMNLNLIKAPIAWLSNRWTANIIIWSLGIWKGIGWVMIVYLAALQGINKSYYEAAEIDGANGIQKFLYITIPSVRPITFYILVNLIIGSFNVFIQVLMITNGGPMGRTEVLLSYMYKVAFTEFKFGYSSALSVLMGLVIFTITILQQRLFKDQKV